jgi:uncharacterized membrane protein YeaQ/YmgE (transglycosylase-associated protein family)
MPVSLEALIILVVVGLIAGFLAGMIVRGGGLGVVGNIIIGVIGAFVGTYLFSVFNIVIAPGLLGTIIAASVGAIIVLLVLGLLRR